jgi:hypothetical protein
MQGTQRQPSNVRAVSGANDLTGMQRYKERTADSGVLSYKTGPDWFIAQFKDGSAYLYTYRSSGARSIEAMKKLAAAGNGLTTYINKYVRKAYARKVQ